MLRRRVIPEIMPNFIVKTRLDRGSSRHTGRDDHEAIQYDELNSWTADGASGRSAGVVSMTRRQTPMYWRNKLYASKTGHEIEKDLDPWIKAEHLKHHPQKSGALSAAERKNENEDNGIQR